MMQLTLELEPVKLRTGDLILAMLKDGNGWAPWEICRKLEFVHGRKILTLTRQRVLEKCAYRDLAVTTSSAGQEQVPRDGSTRSPGGRCEHIQAHLRRTVLCV